MKNIVLAIALTASIPGLALAKPAISQIAEINELKSFIRDDYRQLQEDREHGDIVAAEATQQQIAIDKAALKDAYARHGLKYTEGACCDRTDRIYKTQVEE